MVPFSPVRPARTWVGRTGAFLATVSAVVHMAGLVGHGSAHRLIIAAMAVGCLYCASHLWTRATRGDWALVAIMNVGMIAAHQNMSMPGSHVGHGVSSSTSQASMPSMNAALAVAAVEVVFATAVLFVTTRSVSVRDLRSVATR